MRTVLELQQIANAGGGLTLDASSLKVADLKAIANSASGKGARITIINASELSTQDLCGISSSGKGAVAFADV